MLAYAAEKLLARALSMSSAFRPNEKGRAGSLLTVLCKPSMPNEIDASDFCRDHALWVSRRRETAVSLAAALGDRHYFSGVKYALRSPALNGSISNSAPEYEDCRGLAEAHMYR